MERERVCVVNVFFKGRGVSTPTTILSFQVVLVFCLLQQFVCVLVFFRVMSRVGGIKRHYEEVQPQTQKRVVEDDQRGVRGHGYKAIAKKHGLPVPTVQHVIESGTDWGNPSRTAEAQEEKVGR